MGVLAICGKVNETIEIVLVIRSTYFVFILSNEN